LLRQVARVDCGLLAVRMAGDGNQAIVSDRVFATLSLHDFKHANDLALQDKPRRGRGVVQDQRVDGVAIFTFAADVGSGALHSGKKVGTTNVSVFDQSMKLIGVLDVQVAIDTGNLQQKIRFVTGSRGIRVGRSNGQIVLSGVAGNAVAAERAVAVTRGRLVD
jgi:Pilus formation protein N terminal region